MRETLQKIQKILRWVADCISSFPDMDNKQEKEV